MTEETKPCCIVFGSPLQGVSYTHVGPFASYREARQYVKDAMDRGEIDETDWAEDYVIVDLRARHPEDLGS